MGYFIYVVNIDERSPIIMTSISPASVSFVPRLTGAASIVQTEQTQEQQRNLDRLSSIADGIRDRAATARQATQAEASPPPTLGQASASTWEPRNPGVFIDGTSGSLEARPLSDVSSPQGTVVEAKLKEQLLALETLKAYAEEQRNGKSSLVVSGTDNADRLVAVGALVVNAGEGDDTITALDVGRINAGAGNDTVRAARFVSISGDEGDDVILASNGQSISGGAGNDTVRARDVGSVSGGAGNDNLAGMRVSTLSGGSGDDVITGFDGKSIDGGAGNDTVFARSTTSVDGGTGNNQIDALGSRYARAGALGDNGTNAFLLGDIARVQGGDGIDTVTGENLSSVYTYGGNDQLVLSGVSDRIDTGSGNDVLQAERAAVVYGGAGNDDLSVSSLARTDRSPTDVRIGGGAGNDVLRFGLTVDGEGVTDRAIIEFNEGDGSDTVILNGDYVGARRIDTFEFKGQGDLVTRQFTGSVVEEAGLLIRRAGDDALASVERDGHDLVLSFSSGDNLRLTNFGVNDTIDLEYVNRSDQSVFDLGGGGNVFVGRNDIEITSSYARVSGRGDVVTAYQARQAPEVAESRYDYRV